MGFVLPSRRTAAAGRAAACLSFISWEIIPCAVIYLPLIGETP
jgi:hypothetical protein